MVRQRLQCRGARSPGRQRPFRRCRLLSENHGEWQASAYVDEGLKQVIFANEIQIYEHFSVGQMSPAVLIIPQAFALGRKHSNLQLRENYCERLLSRWAKAEPR